MVSCWSFLCSGLSCLAHTREMFTSLWRSSNHLELSRQPEGPGLRCHLQLFTIDSINENSCCRYLNLAAVGDSSGPRRCLRPLFSDQEGDTALQPDLSDEQKIISNPFFSGIFAPVLPSWTVLEGEWLILTGKKFTLMTNQTSSKNQNCAPTWI